MARFLALLLLATCAAACHARDPFRLTQRRMQNLLHQASVATGCPAVAMTSERLSDRVFRVSGCGTYVDYAAYTRGRGRYTSARWRRVVPVTERAAAQLGCPAASATFTPQGPLRYLVTGCGQSATFDLQCGDLDCAWVSSGASAAAVPAPSAAVVAVVPPPPAAVDPSAAMSAAIASVRTSALACSGGQPFTARLAWDGGGHVSLALAAPFGGTAVESCVAGVLSQARISGTLGTPGEVVVTVR